MLVSQPITVLQILHNGVKPLAETWSEVWGDEVGALAPKKYFCRPLQNVKFGGDGGGLTVFANYNIQPMDVVYI